MIVAVRYLISNPDAVADLGDLDVALYDGTQPVPENLDDVEFYAIPYGVLDSRFCEPIARMPRLKVVQAMTAGYEHVLPYLRPGLTLANGRGVHDAATAELAVALTLAARAGCRTSCGRETRAAGPREAGRPGWRTPGC